MRARLHAQPGSEITIDLEPQTLVAPDGTTHQFDIAASRKRSLLMGLDDVALTLEHKGRIEAFEKDYKAMVPWLHHIPPVREDAGNSSR